MANKKNGILILVTIFGFLSLLFGILISSGKIKQNPEGTVGNTSGNLNNGGYFCESDGKVYFSNAYDEGALYRMNVDETDIERIGSPEATYINVGGDYLYYYQKHVYNSSNWGFVLNTAGLYRCEKDGKHNICLDKSNCAALSLVDNTLYYTKPVEGKDTLCLFKIDTNKKNMQQVTDYLVNPSCVANSILYYNGTKENHYLYGYDTRTGIETLLAEQHMWFPTLSAQSIYFLDSHSNYCLCRYDMIDGNVTVLTTDRVDTFNVADGYIYYQRNSETQPALIRMDTSGNNAEVVAEGNYSDINITSQYVYFHDFASTVPMYKTPVNGPVNVTTFDNARDAALTETTK